MKCKFVLQSCNILKKNSKKRKLIYVNDYFVFNLTKTYKDIINEYIDEGMIIIKKSCSYKLVEKILLENKYIYRPSLYYLKYNRKYSLRSIVYMIKKPNILNDKLFIEKIKVLLKQSGCKSILFINKTQEVYIDLKKNKNKCKETNKKRLYKKYKGVLIPCYGIYLYRNNHYSIDSGEFQAGFRYRYTRF